MLNGNESRPYVRFVLYNVRRVSSPCPTIAAVIVSTTISITTAAITVSAADFLLLLLFRLKNCQRFLLLPWHQGKVREFLSASRTSEQENSRENSRGNLVGF